MTDPAPHFTSPEDALAHLAEWRQQYDLLMRQRDPLVRAALSGPLAPHGGVGQAEGAIGLTPQTLRRINSREDIPLQTVDHVDDVDWDEYADYLETLGLSIRRQLAALPAPAAGRTFTADDLRAELLIRLAERLRETELTDTAHWQLTMQLRHEAQAGTSVLPEEWRAPAAVMPPPAEWAHTLEEVAGQITAFRIEGPAAVDCLDAEILARARAERPPSSARLAQQADQPDPAPKGR